MNAPKSTLSRPRGRPAWSPFGEPTKPIRIPVSLVSDVLSYLAPHRVRPGNARYEGPAHERPPPRPRPFIDSPRPQAGFPSPAADWVEDPLDLNDLLVKNPPSTFFVRAQGDSMVAAGIQPDSTLVVDRSLRATSGKIVVAAYDGELFVKRLRMVKGKPFLLSEPAKDGEVYAPMAVEDHDVVIWGVVTSVINQL